MTVWKYAFHANIHSNSELIYSCGLESDILDSASIVFLDLMSHLKPGSLRVPLWVVQCANLEKCLYQIRRVVFFLFIIVLCFFLQNNIIPRAFWEYGNEIGGSKCGEGRRDLAGSGGVNIWRTLLGAYTYTLSHTIVLHAVPQAWKFARIA